MYGVDWGKRASRLGWLAALVFALSASSAAASATFTYPLNGQTVSLDKFLNFSFRWTMPPGEAGPTVYVGDQPNFNAQNQFDPFTTWCGGNVDIAYSCRPGGGGYIPTAGMHYAVLATEDAGFNTLISPEVRFSVPYRLGLGCVPGAGCEWPKLSNDWLPFGDANYGAPYTTFNIWGWSNGPKLTIGYALKHGRHVLKHKKRTLTANVFGDVAQPDHLELNVFDFAGIASGTVLRLTVTMTSGNARFTRTYNVRAGGGPKHGVQSRFE